MREGEEIVVDSESGFVSSGTSSADTSCPLLIPVSSAGHTCNCFRKVEDGKTTFVKVLRSDIEADANYRNLFRKEYELGSNLDNPYIVRYLNFTDNGPDCCIEMEYVEGDTLKERLAYNPEYFADSKNVMKFLQQLLEGLHYLHSQQIVHLDLKPDNIMLTRVNNDVRILDLGFSYSGSYQTSIGRNPAFAAPEQLDGSADVDARTDIYAVGKLLELICSNTRLSYSSLFFKRIMHRCMQANKADRFQSIAEMIAMLRHQWRPLKAAVAIIVVMALGILAANVNFHRLIYGYDFSELTLCYNVVSEEDGTCELVKHDPSLMDKGQGNIVLNSTARWEGKAYKIVSVADNAFEDDSTLTTLAINSSTIRFGNEVFRRCEQLSSVYITDDFSNLSHGLFGCCTKLKSFRFPSNITEVPQACFHQTGLTTLSLPEGVTVIHQDAFCDCDSLTTVALPSTLTTLERGVFFQCDNLQEVTIPAFVTNIGQYSFMDCPRLRTVYNYALKPQRVSEIFSEGNNITVYVPAESVELYRNSEYWNKQKIMPMP